MMRSGWDNGSEVNAAVWFGKGTASREPARPARPPAPGSEEIAAGTPPAGARVVVTNGDTLRGRFVFFQPIALLIAFIK